MKSELSLSHGIVVAHLPKPGCQVPEARAEAMLAAGYDDFDQRPGPASWRSAMNDGCYSGAADVIGKYLETHKAQLDAEQVRTLYFHAGQALALGGEEAKSVAFFTLSHDAAATPDWNAYVDAMVAFGKKDREALAAAREAYAKVAKAGSPRLKVIDGMLSCFGKSYRDAMSCD